MAGKLPLALSKQRRQQNIRRNVDRHQWLKNGLKREKRRGSSTIKVAGLWYVGPSVDDVSVAVDIAGLGSRKYVVDGPFRENLPL